MYIFLDGIYSPISSGTDQASKTMSSTVVEFLEQFNLLIKFNKEQLKDGKGRVIICGATNHPDRVDGEAR